MTPLAPPNTMYCTTTNIIPTIPDDLIRPLDQVLEYQNCFKYPEYAHTYASYAANEDLAAFVNSHLGGGYDVRYQVIQKALPVHSDLTLETHKYNYLITTGGDVETRWWDQVDEPRTLLHTATLDVNQWYWMDVATPHDITAPQAPRVSIQVLKAC